jgi:tetratricopeptide (TPR) repeat protein
MAKSSSQISTPVSQEQVENEERGGFFLGNRRLLGIIGIGLLLLIGGVVYFAYLRGKSNDRAQIELARIRPYYDRGEYSVAISGDSSKKMGNEPVRGLRVIVEEFESTPSGKIAALFLGNSYLATNQPDKAAGPYEISAGGDDPLLRSAAHAGLAGVAEAKGQFKEAADEYAKAATEDRLELNTPQYLIGAARNYERAGEKDKAIDNYRRVATQYANTQANTPARLALARYNIEL